MGSNRILKMKRSVVSKRICNLHGNNIMIHKTKKIITEQNKTELKNIKHGNKNCYVQYFFSFFLTCVI